MIWIQNVSERLAAEGPQQYAVRINNGPVLARFEHNREEPLSVCLRKAAQAVADAEHRERMAAILEAQAARPRGISVARKERVR